MDIYFKEEYAKLYEKNGDGKVEFFNFLCDKGKVEYIFLKRPIHLLDEKHFDITTPYGYGGPLFFPNNPDDLKILIFNFRKKFEEYCKKERIISEFIRFHPLLKNYKYMNDYLDVSFLQNTISINLCNDEQILADMTGKARNKIRKAIRNNITVRRDNSSESIKRFMNIYYETMTKNNADSYYYFDEKYFENLFKLGSEQIELFNAYHNEEVVAATTILKGKRIIHYHLSANTKEGYQLSANNLLLVEVAKWGSKNGYNNFHLGGGHRGKSNEKPDTLFKFKSSFNKNEVLEFYTGKKIYDPEIYNRLTKLHENENPEVKNKNLEFFPLYRR